MTTLLVRGVSYGEIAEILEVSKQTIYNDLQVIRSGKNEALAQYTRKQIVAQLHLNALQRARALWRLVEEAERDSVKVNALRELRLNDEHITAKLPEPKEEPLEPEQEEVDIEEMRAKYEQILERVRLLTERRKGLERTLRTHLENGDMEALRRFVNHEMDLACQRLPKID